LLAPYLVWMRVRHHRVADDIESSWVELSDLEENP